MGGLAHSNDQVFGKLEGRDGLGRWILLPEWTSPGHIRVKC